jgi:hypothetical protein
MTDAMQDGHHVAGSGNRIGEVPSDLTHPQTVGVRSDARDLHPSGRQLDEEQNQEAL